MAEPFFPKNIFGQGLFLFLEQTDLLLDAVFDEEAIGNDFVGLADAVGAVNGLAFDGGVPPGIEEDHIVGGGEVEAEAAGFE